MIHDHGNFHDQRKSAPMEISMGHRNFQVLEAWSWAPWTPIGPLRHLVSLFPNTINICWAPEMSRAQFLPKRNFEAMGAQFISGVQLILMVLGAQNHEMY